MYSSITDDCKDDIQWSQQCPGWVASGECQRNPDFMLAACAKSCGKCGGGNSFLISIFKILESACFTVLPSESCPRSPRNYAGDREVIPS